MALERNKNGLGPHLFIKCGIYIHSRLCGLIVRVRVVPRRTVVGDIDRRFDNLSGSHHQSHVDCVSSVYVSGQFSRDVIGCFKSNRWLGRDVIGCWLLAIGCSFTLIEVREWWWIWLNFPTAPYFIMHAGHC